MYECFKLYYKKALLCRTYIRRFWYCFKFHHYLFNRHQLVHINFFHSSLLLKFPYMYFGGLNNHTTRTSRSSSSTHRQPPYCKINKNALTKNYKAKLPLIFLLTTNYVIILATFTPFYSNLFYILYEVDNISPLIFYIYEYNHICNNFKVYAK
jgi:hypothetical protein